METIMNYREKYQLLLRRFKHERKMRKQWKDAHDSLLAECRAAREIVREWKLRPLNLRDGLI
jgi:hypothetical protein